jgi:predicted ATP-grasp superfamily ATP-dependent carboligase
MADAALLLGANFYGTLAAARVFSRAGLQVAVADENRLGRALHSRHVDRRLVHPPLSSPGAVIDWLLGWGTRHPGALLYPSNDHLAWLYAVERDRLSEVFAMLSPGEHTIITLLDKKRLYKACEAVGIEVPETHDAANESFGQTADRTRHWPVLVKPRTHICQLRGAKGFIAHNHHQLREALRRFSEIISYATVLIDRCPDISEPLVQQYFAAGQTDIISISGYADSDGVVAARSAVKVLQQPRKAGNGICFENRPVDMALVEKLSALCKMVGYYGAFEAEFVPHESRALLIDFNPRFYSQMGFDIARDLALPSLIRHAADDDRKAVTRVLCRAGAWEPRGDEVYCHKTIFDLMLAFQGRSGQMTKAEVSRWRTWYATHHATDAVRDPDDRMPAAIDAAQLAGDFLRYPRSFLRDYVLNR